MTVRRLAEMTWSEVRDLAPPVVALWPIGAIEAHGPHLPLSTDVVISEEMARRAADKMSGRGYSIVILPALSFTPAGFAASFTGTIDVAPAAVVGTICDVARGLARHQIRKLVLVNSHVDPANLRAIQEAVGALGRDGALQVAFPNKCQKPWVLKLPEEFQRGGAHAGYYETSLVLAARPDLVRESVRKRLPRIDVNLGQKIRDGAKDFHECGGPEAYFGNPAAATVEDGKRLYDILSDMIVEAAQT